MIAVRHEGAGSFSGDLILGCEDVIVRSWMLYGDRDVLFAVALLVWCLLMWEGGLLFHNDICDFTGWLAKRDASTPKDGITTTILTGNNKSNR